MIPMTDQARVRWLAKIISLIPKGCFVQLNHK
jgi:hypothetical protein